MTTHTRYRHFVSKFVFAATEGSMLNDLTRMRRSGISVPVSRAPHQESVAERVDLQPVAISSAA